MRINLKLAALISIFVLLLGGALVIKKGAWAGPKDQDWSTTELASKLAAGVAFRLVDVRELSEYTAGHIPRAELISLGELSQAIDRLGRHEEIAVICRSGNRSSQAARLLREAGYTNVHNVTGGMLSWPGPTVTGE